MSKENNKTEEEEELDEINLASKDPEDFTPQAPGSDFVGPDAYGDEPSDYLGWTSESKNKENIVKISKTNLIKILNEEISYLLEDCGCGGGHSAIDHDNYDVQEPGYVSMDTEEGLVSPFSKDEALDLVSMIASRTSCPVTQQALVNVVSDLSDDAEGELDRNILGLF